jgi:hypothetical protein
MKKLITIGASVLLVNLSALAQGTILLQNFGTGFTGSGVKDPAGALIGPGATQYTIELLAGTSLATIAPLPTAITTSTWVGNGWFGVGDPAGERVLTGFAAGSFPFFQLRAWNNTGGINSYAAALAAGKAYLPSATWQLVSGGGLNGLGNPTAVPSVPAPALFGMPAGYQLTVPEPSTIVLGALGAAALLLRRRK